MCIRDRLCVEWHVKPYTLTHSGEFFIFIESVLRRCFRVSLDIMSVQANTGPRWVNKSAVAFWRGRDSRQERLDLVRMSHRYPDIIDARLTRMFFFKHTPDLGDTVEPISFFDFFKVHFTSLHHCFSFQFVIKSRLKWSVEASWLVLTRAGTVL